jgi:ArsR family transcriptional regulator
MNPSTETLVKQLKALADLTRMRLIALCRQGECSVGELTGVIGLSQPRISQHLKKLCEAQLLERFRDGQRMYYRLPTGNESGGHRGNRLLDLLPAADPVFQEDADRLRALREEGVVDLHGMSHDDHVDRTIHHEIVNLTVTEPLGTVLDVGCGRGKLIKLLASRANRIVGVDIDADLRQLARAELMLARIPNCSLRQGDMYRLPFADAEFDTVILDEVLADAERPVDVLNEARRQLKPGGRMFVLQSISGESANSIQKLIAAWSATAGLRLAPARLVPKKNPQWLLSVATPTESGSEAA